MKRQERSNSGLKNKPRQLFALSLGQKPCLKALAKSLNCAKAHAYHQHLDPMQKSQTSGFELVTNRLTKFSCTGIATLIFR